MKKKLLAVLMTGTMLAAALTGCGGQESAPTDVLWEIPGCLDSCGITRDERFA